MSDLLAWSDARAVFRLVDELKQLGHEPLSWKKHLLTELASLVGSSVAIGGEAPASGFLSPSTHAGCVDIGWGTESDRSTWLAACDRTEAGLDPSDESVAALGANSFTCERQELATDTAWYRSGMFNEHYRPAGLDHYLLSHRRIPELGVVHYVILFKGLRHPRFTNRDRMIVHCLQRELGEAWRVASRAKLPRRLQETLDWLERGASEKEVADRLGIGRQTVHTYCKLLHKRFDVRSRGELLARARMRPRAPRLVLDAYLGSGARSGF
jgi:DNA-binding CsgD family transcriptional regulator